MTLLVMCELTFTPRHSCTVIGLEHDRDSVRLQRLLEQIGQWHDRFLLDLLITQSATRENIDRPIRFEFSLGSTPIKPGR